MSATLDAARWIAAALVLAYHVRLNVLADMPAAAGPGLRALYLATSCGPQAVIWFFVLSGYLIGGGVAADIRRDRFSWTRYALNRLSRLHVVLLPALATGFALDAARVALTGGFMPDAGDGPASHAAATVLANMLFLQTFLAPTLGSNNPLWSLACEAWYYALFPLLAAPFLRDRSLTARLLPCLSGVAALAFLGAHNPRFVHLFPIWLLGVGARFCPAPPVRSTGLAWALAGAGMLAYPPAFAWLGAAANLLVAVPFANLLLTMQHRTREADRARTPPGARLHAALAGFSFSLYVVHAPLLHFVLALANGTPDPALRLPPSGWAPLAWGGALCAGAMLYAWGFSRLTEAHTDRLRARVAGLLFRKRSESPG